ncbi:MAG: ribonuclease HII [Hyphomicrobiales bacterium]|nr:ribonuclease HII [Hyphomicrobiales bacterium]MDE2114926.1 ribonuclease HII [Hyphomicrobiales bacterium]
MARGFRWIAGVDEVGRGPLAGPVTAAAVILDPDNIPPGLNDSKQLRPARRDALYDLILEKALAVSVASVPAAMIDRVNIRQASLRAMEMAVRGLDLPPQFIFVDGRDVPPHFAAPAAAIIKGDAKVMTIAAASIIAKVTRDRLMKKYARLWPGYGFEKHMGYATAQHLKALALQGPCRLHRFSFAPIAPRN